MSDESATIRVSPEAMAAAAGHVRARSGELETAQVDAGHALGAAAVALDPTSRAALAELVQAWGILGAHLARTSDALAASLAASAGHYHAAEAALAGSIGPATDGMRS